MSWHEPWMLGFKTIPVQFVLYLCSWMFSMPFAASTVTSPGWFVGNIFCQLCSCILDLWPHYVFFVQTHMATSPLGLLSPVICDYYFFVGNCAYSSIVFLCWIPLNTNPSGLCDCITKDSAQATTCYQWSWIIFQHYCSLVVQIILPDMFLSFWWFGPKRVTLLMCCLHVVFMRLDTFSCRIQLRNKEWMLLCVNGAGNSPRGPNRESCMLTKSLTRPPCTKITWKQKGKSALQQPSQSCLTFAEAADFTLAGWFTVCSMFTKQVLDP